MDGSLVVNNDGLHGMYERCGSVTLTSGSHIVYIEGFQAGGGVGMEAFYSGLDTGNTKVFLRSGAAPSSSATPSKYYSKCDPTAGGDATGFTVCLFRSEVGLTQIPTIGNADTGINRLYYVGKGVTPYIDFRNFNQIQSVVPNIPDYHYAWAIYGTLQITNPGSYNLCITSDDGYICPFNSFIRPY